MLNLDIELLEKKLSEIEIAEKEELGSSFRPFSLKKRVDEAVVVHCETLMDINFPDSFRDVLTHYSIDNLSPCNIHFGHGNCYLDRLVEINKSGLKNAKWWRGDERPRELICIADGDPYTVILNVQNGEIYPFVAEEWGQWKAASTNFEIFLASLIYIDVLFLSKEEIKDGEGLISEIIKLNKAQNDFFWRNTVQTYLLDDDRYDF